MPDNKEIVLLREGKDPKYIPVETNPFRIGKSPVCELQLTSKGIPRHQCDIIETKTGYKLLDRSGKGTSVNGKKVNEVKLSLVGISKALSPVTLTISEFQTGMLAQAFVFIEATDRRSR